LILAKQTGCFAPGCKFNVESTDPPASQARVLRAGVLLPFRPMAENSSHPLRGWWLTLGLALISTENPNFEMASSKNKQNKQKFLKPYS
jgi:hypothetical protein